MATRSRSPVPLTGSQRRSRTGSWRRRHTAFSPQRHGPPSHSPQRLIHDPEYSAKREAILLWLHPYKNALPLQEETRHRINNPWTQGWRREILARMVYVHNGRCCTVLQLRENGREWFEATDETLPPFLPAPVLIRKKEDLNNRISHTPASSN